MRVLILGCGPAGLIAAHAAMKSGASVMIMSKPRKSLMKGAQYLHRPIPDVSPVDPFQIEYLLRGTAQGYRFKVYGRKWDGTVSPEDMTASHSAWDIRATYDALWDLYGSEVVEWEATPGGLKHSMERLNPDLVVSTIPAPLLCSQGHQFRAARVWSSDAAMFGDESVDNTVICDGQDDVRWYRSSRIQGWETTEWPDGAKPPVVPIWEVTKPTDTNCDCFPDVVRAGRYGEWRKGVLSHEAFDKVFAALSAKDLA